MNGQAAPSDDFNRIFEAVHHNVCKMEDLWNVLIALTIWKGKNNLGRAIGSVAPRVAEIIELAILHDFIRIASALNDPAKDGKALFNLSLEALVQAAGVHSDAYPERELGVALEEYKATFSPINTIRNKALHHFDRDAAFEHEVHKHFIVNALQIGKLTLQARLVVEHAATMTCLPSPSRVASDIAEQCQVLAGTICADAAGGPGGLPASV